MNFHLGKRLFFVAAVLGAVALFAAAFFVALGVRSVVAEPDSAPAAAAPNPGHEWSDIGLPAGTWPGLDADTVDGMDTGQSGTDYIPYADASGNVGIGTTSPGSNKLYVNDYPTTADGASIGTYTNLGGNFGSKYGIQSSAYTGANTGTNYLYSIYGHARTDSWGAATNNLYGVYGYGESDTSGGSGQTHNLYGVYAKAIGDTDGTQTAYGLYATASGADTNWAGYFDAGNVYIKDNVGIGTSPAYELDVSGDANAQRLCIEGDCKSSWPTKHSIALTHQDSALVYYGNSLDLAEGLTMIRDGSIVGMSAYYDVTSIENSPNLNLYVVVEGSSYWYEAMSATVGEDYTHYFTKPRDELTFSAGDEVEISLKCTKIATNKITVDDVGVMVEFYYDD